MPSITITEDTAGALGIAIDNTGTETSGTNEIFRRPADGSEDYIRIASGLGLDASITDYGVASGVEYRYKASFTNSDPNDAWVTSAEEVGSTSWFGVYVHALADPVGTLLLLQFDGFGRSQRFDTVTDLEHSLSDTYPTAAWSEVSEHEVSTEVWMDFNTKAALKALIESRRPIVYRDGRGTKVIGIVPEITFQGDASGFRTELAVIASDAVNEEEV